MAGAVEGDHFIGERAQELRGLLSLSHPMETGIVTSWDDMERVWLHAFAALKAQPEQHPVLLTEAPLNPRKNRERAAEILFESFNVPSLCACRFSLFWRPVSDAIPFGGYFPHSTLSLSGGK